MHTLFSLRSQRWEGVEQAAVSVRETRLGVGSVVANKYRIDGLLGTGGMGVVFAATNMFTGKHVALKWMLHSTRDRSCTGRFLREARAAARIDHPHVINVYDVGRFADSLYIVMERLSGESLYARIRRAPLPPDELVGFMIPVTGGVAAAHREGIVHRDLKPENIFLCRQRGTRQAQPKILDFGLAKVADDCSSSRLTRSSLTVGTPHYMAPEQAQGSRHVSALADVYALGVTMYQCLSGKLPFVGDNYNALIFRIGSEAPPPLRQVCPGVPRELERVVMRAMARDADRRYQSALALGTALRDLWPASGPATRHPNARQSASSTKAGRSMRDAASEPRLRRDGHRVCAGRVTPAVLASELRRIRPRNRRCRTGGALSDISRRFPANLGRLAGLVAAVLLAAMACLRVAVSPNTLPGTQAPGDAGATSAS